VRTAPPADLQRLERTLRSARERLLASRTPRGFWEGRLSSSALSTATAAAALETVRRRGGPDLGTLVAAGLRWLETHQNPDGGFGDTLDSPSNPSTTTLGWAALGLRPETAGAFRRAQGWLERTLGDLSPPALAAALARRYGDDRTFSAPILVMAALAGRLGDGPEAWAPIPPLPFELAALPRALFRWLNLRVVSYALPALIAIGQAQHVHGPRRNPVARLVRSLARGRTLRTLEAIQPASGGFLEATPLTSFVTMCLASIGEVHHPVTRRAVEFLKTSAREDGSWPIDTNLATWVTTLSVGALGTSGAALPDPDRRTLRAWLLAQQTRTVHPYTGSPPGGWAWTDLSGGVPDGDDTPGALLALDRLRDPAADPEADGAARAGIQWLLELQNRDGGLPTFCRGWGKLPFDRSCPDLTAHAARAWSAWRPRLDGRLARRVDRALERAFVYLRDVQRPDGSWVPLWFGNQAAPNEENPVYGTSRVLLAAGLGRSPGWSQAVARGLRWLEEAQHPEGGFGGAPGVAPTIEETALAVEALAAAGGSPEAIARGCRWLAERTEGGTRFEPAPIGLYFARLWYSEALYPVIFTVAALGRALAPR
jgi:squalene-hopene/tetraprenyl-beta-curcumene cyclase